MTKSRTCDVLTIGGGSTGLRATIEAHDAGAQVLVISKGKKEDPHTTQARRVGETMQLLVRWIRKIVG